MIDASYDEVSTIFSHDVVRFFCVLNEVFDRTKTILPHAAGLVPDAQHVEYMLCPRPRYVFMMVRRLIVGADSVTHTDYRALVYVLSQDQVLLFLPFWR